MSTRNFLLSLLPTLFCLSVCTSSCHRHTDSRPVLAMVDSVCGYAPLEALKILDSIEVYGPNLSTYEKHKCALLRVKARDKAWIAHSSEDSIKNLVKYFERAGTVNDILEAYYYMAGTYRDLHDIPQAMAWYLKAAEYGDAHLPKTDAEVLRCVYSQLAFLLHHQHEDSLALEAAKREYHLSADSLTDPQTPMDLATLYVMNYQYDSAYIYYKRAMRLIQGSPQKGRYIGLVAAQMSQYSDAGMRKEADECMDIIYSLPERKHFNSVAWSRAIYFLSFGPKDSAVIYFRDALDDSREVGRKANAAHNLLRLFGDMNERDSAFKYALLYSELQDSVYEEQKREQTANVLNEFRYRRDKRAEEDAYRKALETRAMGWMVMALALAALLMGGSGFFAYRLHTTREMARKNLEIKEKKIQLKTTQDELASAKEERDEAQEERRHLERQRDWEFELRQQVEIHTADVIRELKIVAHHPLKQCSEDLWRQAFALVDKNYPDLSLRLKTDIPDISAEDVKQFYLHVLGMTQEEISSLLGCSRMTVIRHKANLDARLSLPLRTLKGFREKG